MILKDLAFKQANVKSNVDSSNQTIFENKIMMIILLVNVF